jgi:hypothetical protein
MASDAPSSPAAAKIGDTAHLLDAVENLQASCRNASVLRAMFGPCDAGSKPIEDAVAKAKKNFQQPQPN